MIYKISTAYLTVEGTGAILKNHATLGLSDDARQRIVCCHKHLGKKVVELDVSIYSVTTGSGSSCDVPVDKDRLAQLQVNLIMSYACGMGSKVPNDIVKITLFFKTQSLSYGHFGCQVETVERLIDSFNNDVHLVVYTQGSLGASGDPVPLAHLCLPLLGIGEVEYKGERMNGETILQKMNWKPIQLASKEGLALLNGTQGMNVYAVWAVLQSKCLCDRADKIGVMPSEAYDRRIESSIHAVHAVRPHKGQIDTAVHIQELLKGSELIRQPKVNVQDPYLPRCMPRVHGAPKDTLAYVRSVIEIELNVATDSPVVCPDDGLAIPVSNFYGEPIAQPMGFLATVLCELNNIFEQRIYKLISGMHNLPSLLVAKPGLNGGPMIPQYVAASIVSQSKIHSTPASVDNIPSSQGQEDHVSTDVNVATRLYQVMLNTERVLVIGLFNVTQVPEFHRLPKSSPAIEAIYVVYRRVVLFIKNDEFMLPYIA